METLIWIICGLLILYVIPGILISVQQHSEVNKIISGSRKRMIEKFGDKF